MTTDVALVELTRGYVAVVDAQDAALVADHKWRVRLIRHYQYAVTTIGRRPTRAVVYMHRMVVGVSTRSVLVDHRDGDGLHNRRSNLRRATYAENRANSFGVRGRNVAKGVRKHRGRWQAAIEVDQQPQHLGSYATEAEAVAAYEAAALIAWGEFATCSHRTDLHVDHGNVSEQELFAMAFEKCALPNSDWNGVRVLSPTETSRLAECLNAEEMPLAQSLASRLRLPC